MSNPAGWPNGDHLPERACAPRRGRAIVARCAVPVVVALVLLGGCAAGPNPAAGGSDLPGFWMGLWQGVISPVAFVVSIFTDDVSIYEVRNSGNWYDAGFMLGVAIAFSGSGGGSAAARRRSRGGSSRRERNRERPD